MNISNINFSIPNIFNERHYKEMLEFNQTKDFRIVLHNSEYKIHSILIEDPNFKFYLLKRMLLNNQKELVISDDLNEEIFLKVINSFYSKTIENIPLSKSFDLIKILLVLKNDKLADQVFIQLNDYIQYDQDWLFEKTVSLYFNIEEGEKYINCKNFIKVLVFKYLSEDSGKLLNFLIPGNIKHKMVYFEFIHFFIKLMVSRENLNDIIFKITQNWIKNSILDELDKLALFNLLKEFLNFENLSYEKLDTELFSLNVLLSDHVSELKSLFYDGRINLLEKKINDQIINLDKYNTENQDNNRSISLLIDKFRKLSDTLVKNENKQNKFFGFLGISIIILILSMFYMKSDNQDDFMLICKKIINFWDINKRLNNILKGEIRYKFIKEINLIKNDMNDNDLKNLIVNNKNLMIIFEDIYENFYYIYFTYKYPDNKLLINETSIYVDKTKETYEINTNYHSDNLRYAVDNEYPSFGYDLEKKFITYYEGRYHEMKMNKIKNLYLVKLLLIK